MSNGELFYAVNHGNNNRYTIWNFVLSLALQLAAKDLEWRDHFVIQLDNVPFHHSHYFLEKVKTFGVPILFSGPYSYDGAAVEKAFACIKAHDLNPLQRSFQSRSSIETYIVWLAEAIKEIDFGDITGYFRRALQASQRYLLFEDI